MSGPMTHMFYVLSAAHTNEGPVFIFPLLEGVCVVVWGWDEGGVGEEGWGVEGGGEC